MKPNVIITLLALALLLAPGSAISQVAINTDGSTPDNSAMLVTLQ